MKDNENPSMFAYEDNLSQLLKYMEENVNFTVNVILMRKLLVFR